MILIIWQSEEAGRNLILNVHVFLFALWSYKSSLKKHGSLWAKISVFQNNKTTFSTYMGESSDVVCFISASEFSLEKKCHALSGIWNSSILLRVIVKLCKISDVFRFLLCNQSLKWTFINHRSWFLWLNITFDGGNSLLRKFSVLDRKFIWETWELQKSILSWVDS